MGKNYLNNCQSIVNTTDLTLKQMFDISTRFVSEQNEISGLETIGWENHSWKHLSLIGDETVISLQRAKVYVFSDSVLCFGKMFENPESNDAWEQRLGWLKSSQNYRNFDRIDDEPMEFEWNIFPGSNTLQLCGKVHRSSEQITRNTRNFHRKNAIYVDVQRHFLWNKRQYNRMSGKCQSRLHSCKEVWYWTNGHLLVQVPKRSGILWKRTVHKEFGITSRKRWCWDSQKADVQFSVLRHHWPEVNSKPKDMENCRYTMQPTRQRLRLFFA